MTPLDYLNRYWNLEVPVENELGIPKARYKQGYVWVRVTSDDHPYCHLYQINIIQDYAGGGTYGASYAKFLDNNLSGCPAGQ